MKIMIRVEYGAFDCRDSENDSTNESGFNNANSNNNSKTPRTNASKHGNDNVEDKRKTSPNRIIDAPANVNRRR